MIVTLVDLEPTRDLVVFQHVPYLPKFPLNSPPKMSECTICIESLSSLENVSALPCGHCFHADCIEQWGRTPQVLGPKCPICHVRFSLERPRGVVRRLFLSDARLVKAEVLEELSVLRESSDIDARLSAKEQELKLLRPKVDLLDKKLKEAETKLEMEMRQMEIQMEYVRVVENKSGKLERRYSDLEARLMSERKSKVDTVNQLVEEVKTVTDQLRLKEAEVVVAEWTVGDAKKEMRALEEETDRRRKRAEEEVADAEKRMEALRGDLERKDRESERDQVALANMRRSLKTLDREYVKQGEDLVQKKELYEKQKQRISELEKMVVSGEEELCGKDSQVRDAEKIISELE